MIKSLNSLSGYLNYLRSQFRFLGNGVGLVYSIQYTVFTQRWQMADGCFVFSIQYSVLF